MRSSMNGARAAVVAVTLCALCNGSRAGLGSFGHDTPHRCEPQSARESRQPADMDSAAPIDARITATFASDYRLNAR